MGSLNLGGVIDRCMDVMFARTTAAALAFVLASAASLVVAAVVEEQAYNQHLECDEVEERLHQHWSRQFRLVGEEDGQHRVLAAQPAHHRAQRARDPLLAHRLVLRAVGLARAVGERVGRRLLGVRHVTQTLGDGGKAEAGGDARGLVTRRGADPPHLADLHVDWPTPQP